MSKNGWTPERKKRQSEKIKSWKPWKESTGPKSQEGKDIAKMNAYKHGLRSQTIQELLEVLRNHKNFIKGIDL